MSVVNELWKQAHRETIEANNHQIAFYKRYIDLLVQYIKEHLETQT